MRTAALVVLLIVSVQGNPYVEDPSLTSTGVLLLWPTARSAALAGAMTGLADEADATYFNPAGLARQTTSKAEADHGNWLPGLYPGMYYNFAAGGVPLRPSFLGGRNAYLAGSLTYMTVGETDVVNERGDFLGRFNVWRGVVSLSAAMGLGKRVDVGLTVKGVHIHLTPEWIWGWGHEPEHMGGTGSTWACDVGTFYRPTSCLSVGMSATNIGPGVSYASSGEHYASPGAIRLGACWTPVDYPAIRLRVMPELTKVLDGMFSDTTGKSFSRQFGEEWKDVWKAIGVEATAFGLVSLRLGYFEDLSFQRGGIVIENEGQTYHYGVWDAITRKNLGSLKSIGLCWGLGFGTNKLRFDFSSDAAIYDFPTTNWKFQLVSNDIGGLFRRRS